MKPINNNNKAISYAMTQNLENKKNNNIITHLLDTNEKKIGAGVGFVALLTLFATKGKSIVKGIKKASKAVKTECENLFKKGKKEVNDIKPEKPPVKKFELPEPKFTCGEENPKQLAKEKAEYIKSIWDETVTTYDKEKRVAGLEAIEKYGTMKDIENLPLSYKHGQNDTERIAFCKAIEKLGKGRDVTDIIKSLEHSQNDETRIQILKHSLSLLKKETGKIILYKRTEVCYTRILDNFVNNENQEISDLAKKVSSLIELK